MKKKVKTLVFLTASLFLFNDSHAQLKLPAVSSFGNDLKKIIEDYPDHFSHLTGERIAVNAQSTDYKCSYNVSGAEESTITEYSSKNNNVYSWQAVMLSTDDFEIAQKKFKSLYRQINNLLVSVGGLTKYHLKGEYEAPREEKKFTSVLFSFDPPDESSQKLKTELSIEFYAPMEWRVKVLVYDRDREDDERGKMVED